MHKWLWGYAGTVLFVGAIIVAQNVWCLSKSDWASWVQAIGSIAAIMAAYWLASRQQRIADHAAERERTRLRYRAANYAIAILEEGVFAIGDFGAQLNIQKDREQMNFELTWLDSSLAALQTAVHQHLPSEVLDQVLVGLRAVQIQTRVAHKIGNTKFEILKSLTDKNSEWAISAHSEVKKSREKWRFQLNEASIEE